MPRSLYVDSSALVKLVAPEPESQALRTFLEPDDVLVSSVLARIEVVRAARRRNADREGRVVAAALETVELDNGIIEDASVVEPESLSSFDAIHLVSALRYRDRLDAFVAYDARLVAAARAAGLAVTSPA